MPDMQVRTLHHKTEVVSLIGSKLAFPSACICEMHGQGKPSQPEPSRPGAISNRNRAKQIYNRNLLLKIVRPIGSRLASSRCVRLGNASEPAKAVRAEQGGRDF